MPGIIFATMEIYTFPTCGAQFYNKSCTENEKGTPDFMVIILKNANYINATIKTATRYGEMGRKR